LKSIGCMVRHCLPQLNPLDRNACQVANGHEAISEGVAILKTHESGTIAERGCSS